MSSSIETMAKMFIAPLMKCYTFQDVSNEVSDNRYGDEYIDGEEINVSNMFNFLKDHENAHFVYNFIEKNKDEIIRNIYHESFKSEYMKNICGFWYIKFSDAGWEEYDMDSFMNMHKSHNEYFEGVIFFRLMRVLEHDKKYYDSKFPGKKKLENVSPFLTEDLFVALKADLDGIEQGNFIKDIMQEFTKEQVCKLIPIIPYNGFVTHLMEDDIECEVNESFEEVVRRLKNDFLSFCSNLDDDVLQCKINEAFEEAFRSLKNDF